MAAEPAIIVDHLSKTFRLPHEKNNSVKSLLLNFRKRRTYEKQNALKDVSFTINQGEFFGIVGRNGSGKSTLLKLLAGIYTPSKGQVHVNGKLTPFIELGVGFNPELTGKENVYLNGALLGFSRKEIAAIYDEIVEFAELKEFMDQKLKNYSSGMQVRLAFSVAIRAQGDILLIDEVLAVGDAAFQQKCYDVFEKLKAEKRTIVFVSHDMAAVKRYCERAVLVERGEFVKLGNPTEIAQDYGELNEKEIDRETTKENIKRAKDRVLQAKLLGEHSRPQTQFKYGDTAKVKLQWPKSVPAHNAGISIYKQTGEYVFGSNTLLDDAKVGEDGVEFEVELNIGTGSYFVVMALMGKEESELIEFVDQGPSFKVLPPKKPTWEGLLYLKHSWKI